LDFSKHVKPALATLFNSTISELWLESDFKDRIFITEHELDCVAAIRLARFKESRTGRFGGVHFFGSSGKKALTNSVLDALEKVTSILLLHVC